jgi:hypothetical protein
MRGLDAWPIAAVPPDVRWWLCPTVPRGNTLGLRPMPGRSPNSKNADDLKGVALPHVERHSRAETESIFGSMVYKHLAALRLRRLAARLVGWALRGHGCDLVLYQTVR